MIKFRGIPLEDVSSIDGVNFDGKFVYGNYAKNGAGALIIGDVLEAEEDVFWPSWWVPVDPKTVGQFTGLQDANGKDIYDGDVLATSSIVGGGEVTDYLKVEWREDYAGFYCGEKPLYAYLSEWDNDIKLAQTYPEIVGNIHINKKFWE